ncbi:hypothetical protein BH11PSE12_BH11PSE12_27950 [soil metagenome]
MYARTELSRLQRLAGFLRLLVPLIVRLIAIFSAAQGATVYAQESGLSGQTRMLWIRQSANPESPVTRAAQLLPGLLATSGQVPQQVAVLDTELHISARGVSGVATVRGQADNQGNTQATAWINELYVNTASDDGAWQFSAGKKLWHGMSVMAFAPMMLCNKKNAGLCLVVLSLAGTW